MAHGVGSSEKASETRLRVGAKRLIPDRLEVDAGVEARAADGRFREEDRDRGIRDSTPISHLGRGLGTLVRLPGSLRRLERHFLGGPITVILRLTLATLF